MIRNSWGRSTVRLAADSSFAREHLDEPPPDYDEEDSEEGGRQGVEDQREDDCETVARLHEAEERRVLADEQAREQSERDPRVPIVGTIRKYAS